MKRDAWVPGTRWGSLTGAGGNIRPKSSRSGRTRRMFAILGRQEVDRELPIDIHLGVSLPKGDRQKWLVEKSVELGVGRLIPLKTARSVAQPVEQALARLKRRTSRRPSSAAVPADQISERKTGAISLPASRRTACACWPVPTRAAGGRPRRTTDPKTCGSSF